MPSQVALALRAKRVLARYRRFLDRMEAKCEALRAAIRDSDAVMERVAAAMAAGVTHDAALTAEARAAVERMDRLRREVNHMREVELPAREKRTDAACARAHLGPRRN